MVFTTGKLTASVKISVGIIIDFHIKNQINALWLEFICFSTHTEIFIYFLLPITPAVLSKCLQSVHKPRLIVLYVMLLLA